MRLRSLLCSLVLLTARHRLLTGLLLLACAGVNADRDAG